MEEIRDLSEHEIRSGNPGVSIVRWPDDIGAGVAEYGQFVINRQTADHDVLVCVVGARMGSPTPRANSGTEEEFDGAIEAILKGRNVQVLLFFSNMPVHPLSIDPQQLMLVRAFREKAGRLGVLYHTFGDHEELRRLVRPSLREAYGRRRAKATSSKYQRIKAKRGQTSMTIALPDIDFRYRGTAPQGADVRLIPIAEHRRTDIRLTGIVTPLSTYLRFGFKYFESREQLFSSGSIQTVGQNLLVHIGRNKNDPIWFVTEYRAGYRVYADKPLPFMAQKNTARFALDISADGTIRFFLDDEPIYTGFLPIDGLPSLAILAWGDENEFQCEVRDLKLNAWARTPGAS